MVVGRSAVASEQFFVLFWNFLWNLTPLLHLFSDPNPVFTKNQTQSLDLQCKLRKNEKRWISPRTATSVSRSEEIKKNDGKLRVFALDPICLLLFFLLPFSVLLNACNLWLEPLGLRFDGVRFENLHCWAWMIQRMRSGCWCVLMCWGISFLEKKKKSEGLWRTRMNVHHVLPFFVIFVDLIWKCDERESFGCLYDWGLIWLWFWRVSDSNHLWPLQCNKDTIYIWKIGFAALDSHFSQWNCDTWTFLEGKKEFWTAVH